MPTYEKVKLSADTGMGFSLYAPGSVNVHTTGTSATVMDEVWLWIANNDSTATAECEVGNPGAGYIFYVKIPPKTGLNLVLPGVVWRGSGSAGRTITVTETVGSANDVYISGYVNRITP